MIPDAPCYVICQVAIPCSSVREAEEVAIDTRGHIIHAKPRRQLPVVSKDALQ